MKSNNNIILPQDSQIFEVFTTAAQNDRIVFFSGLPGVGKSLMAQQMTEVALMHGRKVHLLQWDVARLAFEQDAFLERFPEVDGITHAAIRLAAGEWVRDAIVDWHKSYAGSEHMLIGECTLFGNRFSELACPKDDPSEEILSGQGCRFLTPAPTLEVRAAIEQARRNDFENPQHEREAGNAAPNVLDMAVKEVYAVGTRQGVIEPQTEGYLPASYIAVYQHLLRHRQHDALLIDQVLPVKKSAYDLKGIESELSPHLSDVDSLFTKYSQMKDSEMNKTVSSWWDY